MGFYVCIYVFFSHCICSHRYRHLEYTHAHTHTCIHTTTHACTCTDALKHKKAHNTQGHTHTYTHTHTHTHTHLELCGLSGEVWVNQCCFGLQVLLSSCTLTNSITGTNVRSPGRTECSWQTRNWPSEDPGMIKDV